MNVFYPLVRSFLILHVGVWSYCAAGPQHHAGLPNAERDVCVVICYDAAMGRMDVDTAGLGVGVLEEDFG